jgi:hypothetical protein
MKRPLMRLWQRMLRRFGRPGIVAVALLVAALVMAALIPGLQRQGDQLRLALTSTAAAASRPGPALPRTVPVEEQIHDFVAAFPPLAQSPGDLDEVFQSARRRKVPLLKGEYQLQQDTNAPLVTYTATFPVRAEYSAIKDFTADVLRALPNASMDELRMTRSAAGTTALESVIRFSFVYRRL